MPSPFNALSPEVIKQFGHDQTEYGFSHPANNNPNLSASVRDALEQHIVMLTEAIKFLKKSVWALTLLLILLSLVILSLVHAKKVQ
jgi:hypothetical protein